MNSISADVDEFVVLLAQLNYFKYSLLNLRLKNEKNIEMFFVNLILFFRILVNLDDNIVRHYSNEDTFVIDIMSESTNDDFTYKITLSVV